MHVKNIGQRASFADKHGGLHLLQCYSNSYGVRYYKDKAGEGGAFPPSGCLRDDLPEALKVSLQFARNSRSSRVLLAKGTEN